MPRETRIPPAVYADSMVVYASCRNEASVPRRLLGAVDMELIEEKSVAGRLTLPRFLLNDKTSAWGTTFLPPGVSQDNSISALFGKSRSRSWSQSFLRWETARSESGEILVWITAADNQLKVLSTLQHRVLRLITRAHWWVSNRVLQEDVNMPDLRDCFAISTQFIVKLLTELDLDRSPLRLRNRRPREVLKIPLPHRFV